MKKNQKNESCFFEMINKIDKFEASLAKREKNLQITNSKYRRGDITSQILRVSGKLQTTVH